MSSYLQNLLVQETPLEQHEVRDLREWLAVLQCDCEAFGAASDDVVRMNAIRRVIARNSNPEPRPDAG